MRPLVVLRSFLTPNQEAKMNPKPLYQQIVSSVVAYGNCLARDNKEWELKHRETVETLVSNFMPAGSGFDSGTKLDWDATLRNPAKLVFTTSFHHMNENGMYDGWTEHTVTVSASLLFDFDLRISGRNRNDIKGYMHEVFDSALREPITHDGERYYSPAMREASEKFQATQS